MGMKVNLSGGEPVADALYRLRRLMQLNRV
jgi:hypothetical protein